MKLLLSLLFILYINYSFAKFTEEKYQEEFVQWSHKFKKSFQSREFNDRYSKFKANMDYIETWNAGSSPTILGLTEFADLSNAEYKELYVKKSKQIELNQDLVSSHSQQGSRSILSTNPTAIDWRKIGAVSPVPNTGQCNSAYAFSATGLIEGVTFLGTAQLKTLSEQNLIDCVSTNYGCDDGEVVNALEYVKINKGIDTEALYPYVAEQNPLCSYSVLKKGAGISSYTQLPQTEYDLEENVINGPISVMVDATHPSFQLYIGGVYYEPLCSSTTVSHAMLAVGYNSTVINGVNTPYWILRNTWGSTYGINGYMHLTKGSTNHCGVASSAYNAVYKF